MESELGIVALCGGTYEIGATVDEAEFIKTGGGDEDQKANVDTQTLLQGGNVLGEPKLRTWGQKLLLVYSKWLYLAVL